MNPNSTFAHAAILFALLDSALFCGAQLGDPVRTPPDKTWAGRRILTLEGFGDYFTLDNRGQPQVVKPEGLSVNIVAVVQRVDGDRVWIKANGAGDVAVGWVKTADTILLEQAVPYLNLLIGRNPGDWDAYLRRAEAEHALNQRVAAIADYTKAIALNPHEPFLFLRRGRSLRAMKQCSNAVVDFEEAIRLKPQWAEPYNLEAGVYADCPDSQYRGPTCHCTRCRTSHVSHRPRSFVFSVWETRGGSDYPEGGPRVSIVSSRISGRCDQSIAQV